MATIANDGSEIIASTIIVSPATQDIRLSFAEAYEIESTISEIIKGFYTVVALQFPDDLLQDAVPVFNLLRSILSANIELYILADTTYGSCCVDEVAAQHVDAQIIIHYGHACLSPTARLPVLYVLTKKEIEVELASNSLASTSKLSLEENETKAVVLMYDVGYAHKAEQVFASLQPMMKIPIIFSKIDHSINLDKKGKGRESTPTPSNSDSQSNPATEEVEEETNCPPDGISSLPIAPTPVGLVPSEELPSPNRTTKHSTTKYAFELPEGIEMNQCGIFYLGEESLSLNNILIINGKCPVWSYDPKRNETVLQSSKTNKMLMKRYAIVEKAKDADVIGILVGTLGVASYLPLISTLKALIASKEKKSYTVAVGKLNPAKLANFLEVDCFVLVACEENTLIDSKEFLRPIITPFELELALTSKTWTGEYILDFGTLLNGKSFGEDQIDSDASVADDSDDDRPVYSSTTGKYRHPKKFIVRGIKDEEELTSKASALSIRNQSSAVARILGSAAGEFLANRSYKGLEPRYGMDLPALVEDGRRGIASGYGDEERSTAMESIQMKENQSDEP